MECQVGILNRHERIILNYFRNAISQKLSTLQTAMAAPELGETIEIPSDSSAGSDVLNIFFYKDVGLM